jgi:predicted dehydrogenase
MTLAESSFCIKVTNDINGKHFDFNFAGGSLMDLGIYSISFFSMIFGKQPSSINGNVVIGKTGVDETASMVFTYDNLSST